MNNFHAAVECQSLVSNAKSNQTNKLWRRSLKVTPTPDTTYLVCTANALIALDFNWTIATVFPSCTVMTSTAWRKQNASHSSTLSTEWFFLILFDERNSLNGHHSFRKLFGLWAKYFQYFYIWFQWAKRYSNERIRMSWSMQFAIACDCPRDDRKHDIEYFRKSSSRSHAYFFSFISDSIRTTSHVEWLKEVTLSVASLQNPVFLCGSSEIKLIKKKIDVFFLTNRKFCSHWQQ